MQREGASGVQSKERTSRGRGRGRAGSPSTRPTGPTIKDVVEQVEKQVGCALPISNMLSQYEIKGSLETTLSVLSLLFIS